MEEKPLTRKDHQFVDWFRKYRDIYKAAERAGIAKNQAKKTYERIEIQEEIERQDSVVERERARVQVEAEGITRNMLDAELLQLIMLDPKRYSGAKQRAIELGYVRAGVMQVGNTKSLDLTPPNPDDDAPMPTVYQALFTVGVSATQATPIMPSAVVSPEAGTPSVSSGAPPLTAFQQRVRELTIPSPQTIPPPPPTPSGTIKAGRIKIG